MKKILTSIFALGLVLSLGACGSKKASESNSGSSGDDPADVVLEDKESNSWCLHGQFILADGKTFNGWNGKDNDLYEASKMTAISLNAAKKIDADLGTALASRKVKYLYKYEGAVLGTNASGFTSNFKDANGKMMKADGSYSFKGAKLSYDAEEEVYSEEAWIHDPKVSHAEIIGGDIFMPVWQETPDEDGFSWKENLVVRSGAGVYTIVIAEYDVAVSATQPNFGIAAIKTAEKTGIDYVDPNAWVAEDHTYGIVGSWDASWGVEKAMTKVADGWSVTAAFDANTQFKVRADGKWDNSWGFEAVDTTASSAKVVNADGNIKVNAAGNFTVKISFTGATAKVVVTENV